MKKKKSKTIPPDRTLLHDAHQVIAFTFDAAGLEYYRELVTDILLYSTRNKPYKKETTGDLIWTLERIAPFLAACAEISSLKAQSPLIIYEEDVHKKQLITDKEHASGYWEHFPRMLSLEEFKNPYLAIQAVFKQTTHEHLYDSFKHMISQACNVDYYNQTENTLLLYQQFMKLFEAAHLIDLREVIHTTGYRKYND